MRQLTRRSLLLGGVSLAAIGGITFAALSPRRFVEAVIREHFRPGEVSDADISQFAEDFFAKRPRLRDLKHRIFGRIGRVGLLPVFDDVSQIESLREDALTMFILGSTAMGRVDDSEPITYIAFPDPYDLGCVTTWS